jgi:pimeloyl-ACP methyl ester carboxylesterase
VPVVLLHGYTDSRRSWDLVLPHLPSRFRVYAVSQRGHGLSSRPVRGYHATDLSADLRAFLDAQKISRAVIVGHSMGSMVAQRFAIDNPDRVQGLILTGAFYARRNNPLLVEFWNQAISSLAEPVDPAFIREFQRSTTADSLPTEFFTMVVGESGLLPGWLWRDLFRGFLVTDFTADVGRGLRFATTISLPSALRPIPDATCTPHGLPCRLVARQSRKTSRSKPSGTTPKT